MQAATRMADGQWPWRDFGWSYGPGEPLVVMALGKAFGPSLLWWRLLRVAADATAAVLVYAARPRPPAALGAPGLGRRGGHRRPADEREPDRARPRLRARGACCSRPAAARAGRARWRRWRRSGARTWARSRRWPPRRRCSSTRRGATRAGEPTRAARRAARRRAAATRRDAARATRRARLRARGRAAAARRCAGAARAVVVRSLVAAGGLRRALRAVPRRRRARARCGTRSWCRRPGTGSGGGCRSRLVRGRGREGLPHVAAAVRGAGHARARGARRTVGLLVLGAGAAVYFARGRTSSTRRGCWSSRPLRRRWSRPKLVGAAVLALLLAVGVANRASALLRPPDLEPFESVRVPPRGGRGAAAAWSPSSQRLVPPGEPIYVAPLRSDLVTFSNPLLHYLADRPNVLHRDVLLQAKPEEQAQDRRARSQRRGRRSSSAGSRPSPPSREPNRRGRPSGSRALDDYLDANYRLAGALRRLRGARAALIERDTKRRAHPPDRRRADSPARGSPRRPAPPAPSRS